MGQLVLLHHLELLQVARVQTRVPRDDDLAVLQRQGKPLVLVRDPDVAFALLEHVPRIAHSEQHPGLGDQDPAFLLVAVVDHPVVLLSDEGLDGGANGVERL